MADRYWVGGAGTWDATTTTNWSATSGGGGGASAPTSADNVIFNSASNATAYAVTIGTNANCADVTIAGPASGNVTITSGATAVINVYGSWTNAATGVVFTSTTGSNVNFLATTTGKTITTNNVTLSTLQVTLNGVGGGWSLGSAFTSTTNFFVTAGSFTTTASNYAMSVGQINSNNSNVRSILLNASTITLTGSTVWNFSTTTNLTFNAGTSTIIGSSASSTFNGGGLTYNNVNFTSTGSGAVTISGANTFTTLNFTSVTSNLRIIVFGNNQTVTGTLTFGAANTAVARMIARSDTIGTQRTLTVATIATLADVDFQDIVAAGASGTWSGTRLGNGTNNSNITFDPGKTVYWNLAGAQNWNATGWATSSGGTPAVNNFPLAQDTAIFDNTGAVTGTITIQVSWMLPTINITKTGAMTLASGTQTPRFFGGVTLQAATVTTGTGAWVYAAYGVTSTFTSNGATFTPPLTIQSPTGGITLADAFTQPNTVTTTLTAGTLDLAGYTITTGSFSSTNSNFRSLVNNNVPIIITANNATVVNFGTTTNFSADVPPTFELNYSGAVGTRTIAYGALSTTTAFAPNITVSAGSDTITTSGTTTLRNLVFTSGFTGTLNNATRNIYGNLTLVAGMATPQSGALANTFNGVGSQIITTAGKTLDFPITFSGVGGTWSLQDALTLGSTNTLTLTNGTLQLKAGATSTVGAFASSGTNQKFLQSTTPGSQATLSDASGTNSLSNTTIQDIAATGEATWNAFYQQGNVDAGNNTGWYFGETPTIGAEVTMRLRSFTEPRRF